MRDHANRLARLTDDLLKLARIEAGKLEMEFSPRCVIEFVERCAETALMKASRKQITLDIEIPPGLPPVRGDASLLHDVLQNLVDNAIQYTPPGGRIRVSARVNSNEVVIEVADTGIGIPLIDQERIFERFYRVDAARSREAGGTGLGLSIAKHIIDAHNGRLWVESTVGAGSRFSFSIPLAGWHLSASAVLKHSRWIQSLATSAPNHVAAGKRYGWAHTDWALGGPQRGRNKGQFGGSFSECAGELFDLPGADRGEFGEPRSVGADGAQRTAC